MATNMQREKQLCHAKDVHPDKKNWKVLIQVLQKKKGGISMTAGNPSQYRGYLFVDMTGTFVSAVCHGTDVAYFESSLLPYKRYYISNASVKPVRPGYEVSDYKFSWTLYTTALVEPFEEHVPPPIPYNFQFKKFSDMFRFADSEVPIDIKGLVLKAFPEKKVGLDKYGRDSIVRDFVVIDDDNIPMIMRLWKEKFHDYADLLSEGLPEPVFFLGMHMKVTTFNGLSLSSRLNIIFLKDPLVHGVTTLKEWYGLNKEAVDSLVDAEAYKDTNRLLRKPTAVDIITVKHAMANLEELKTA